MSTNVGPIEAPVAEWPHRDTTYLAALIVRLLQAADGLSSHATDRCEDRA
jgi:hypothetical protein